MTIALSKDYLEKLGESFFLKPPDFVSIKTPQTGENEQIFLCPASDKPVLGRITFSNKSEIGNIVQKPKDIFAVNYSENFLDFMRPAALKLFDIAVNIPLSRVVIDEVGLYFSMLASVLWKLNIDKFTGKLFVVYDEETNEASVEWVMKDRRFGVVSDSLSTSSWFLVKNNGVPDSGDLDDLSQRQMQKIILELLS